MNNYRIIYQNFIDTHKRNGEVNYLRYAFEDTAARMAMDDSMTLIQAREHLNQLIPQFNHQEAACGSAQKKKETA